MLINGIVQWCKVLGPPRENQFNPGNGLWSLDLIVSKDTIKKLKTEGLGWKLKKTEQDNPWAPEGSDYLKFKKNESYVERASGQTKKNDPVKIIDAYGKPWDQTVLIGNGSEVNVRFNTYEGLKKQTHIGVGWEVQVVKLVPYQANEPFPIQTKPEFNDDISHIGNDEDEVIV